MTRWAIAAGFLLLAGAAGGAVALAGGILGAGCATPMGTGSACGGGANATLADFCTQLATADCSPAIVEACYGSSADTRKCIDVSTANCVRAHGEVSSCNPGCLGYDEEYAADCIAAHQSTYGRDTAAFTANDYQILAAACLPVFNSGCLQAAECTSDADCDVNAGLSCVVQGALTGTCQVPSPELAGGPCSGDPTAQCSIGTYCGDAGKCVYSPDGGCAADGKCPACSATVPCYYDVTIQSEGQTFDVNGSRCVDGKCTSKLPDDAGCFAAFGSADDDCLGGFCVGGFCKTIYTFGATTPPSGGTAPGCAYFLDAGSDAG